LKKPWLKLGMGIFTHKYNKDAANLGEYLFRSNPYPNYIYTGIYNIVNNSGAYLQGVKAEWQMSGMSAAVLLLTETAAAPLYDGSLAFLFNYTDPIGLIDVGCGVNFKRLMPVKAERTAPKENQNAYATIGNDVLYLDRNYYRQPERFWRDKGTMHQAVADSLTALGNAAAAAPYLEMVRADSLKEYTFDSLENVVVTYLDSIDGLKDVLNDIAATPAEKAAAQTSLNSMPKPDYYTSSGTILMAIIAIDFKAFFKSDLFSPSDLRIYAEGALLGITDYPIFYEDKMERMPIMFGFNIPTFRLLDLFAIQFEYFNSPYINSLQNVLESAIPIPFTPSGADKSFSQDEYNDMALNDSWKWSVLLRRNIYKSITLSAQFARDHLRLVSGNYWAGGMLEANEHMFRNKDWYWVLQISMGI
jgi:hypothetical protein